MPSQTTAVFPIVSALARAQEFGKAESGWIPGGPGVNEQKRYIPLLASLKFQTSDLFTSEELKSVASDNVDDINSFLKDNGFNIQLPPFTDPDEFATASVMSVLVNWKVPGEETELQIGGKSYPAARLEKGIKFFRMKGYEHPIVKLQTENDDIVHLTVADRSDLSGLNLLNRIKSLDTDDDVRDWGAVIFPMVDLDQEVDINFFLKMGFQGTGSAGNKGLLKILNAMQQTKFKMNHLGAKTESAAAVSLGFECARKPNLIINQAFYVWMTRPGLDEPYFVGYIDPSDWKNPGALK